MKNNEIADEFDQFAEILEFQGKEKDLFRIRSYRRGAQILRNLPEAIDKISFKELIKISGIGEGLAHKIIEYTEKGKIYEFEDEYKKIPPGIFELMKIPTLGPKRMKLLYDSLNITDPAELKTAIEKGEVQKLPTFGEKSAQKLLWGLEIYSGITERVPRGAVYGLAYRILNKMQAQKFVKKAEIAGSFRRGADTVHDLDFLATGDAEKIIEFFCSLEDVAEVMSRGTTKVSVLLKNNLPADLRVVSEDIWGSGLQHFTGSKNHNVHIRSRAKKMGLKISEWGVFKRDKVIAGKTEEEVYKAVGLPWFPPEIREDSGEFQKAKENKLPKLIEEKDIKGDLHLHSVFSDGNSTIEEIAKKAIKRKYEYIAITDHSQALAYIANGLDEKRLIEQKKEIERVQKLYPQIKIFWGTECDILKDGSLDFPDKILKNFDFVIASIHSGLYGDQTKRTMKALQNPYINVLGHPTGRRFGYREEVPADYSKIFKECVIRNIALEINSTFDRLDLRSELAREAVYDYGAKIIINTDSHVAEKMDDIHFGVTVARRAWLEKKHVINTLSLKQFEKFIKKN